MAHPSSLLPPSLCYSAMSSQIHFVCMVLNHSDSLKGLNRPYIYDHSPSMCGSDDNDHLEFTECAQMCLQNGFHKPIWEEMSLLVRYEPKNKIKSHKEEGTNSQL